jgi:peptide chain release factor subunit 1
MGGWSQARYQRHIENFHLHHMKEVVDVLDRVVRDEAIGRIVVSCDDATRATLFDQLPQHLRERVVDTLTLDVNTPEHAVLAETLGALRERDADTDADRVRAMLNAWQADGLAVAGPEATLRALAMGQVEELLITASPELLHSDDPAAADGAPGPIDVQTSATGAGIDSRHATLAGELVAKAQQTSARIRFIEDPALLADVGGAGALLRFKI